MKLKKARILISTAVVCVYHLRSKKRMITNINNQNLPEMHESPPVGCEMITQPSPPTPQHTWPLKAHSDPIMTDPGPAVRANPTRIAFTASEI